MKYFYRIYYCNNWKNTKVLGSKYYSSYDECFSNFITSLNELNNCGYEITYCRLESIELYEL